LSTLEWVFVAGVVVVLFGAGSAVAVWWWRLVARAAPYQDELNRTRGKGRDDAGVVVVGRPQDHEPGSRGAKG